MERYLTEQYNVIENKNSLCKEENIKDYFKDVGIDLLSCGQGYYQDEIDVICKIDDKFYNVSIIAEITSAKQDRGERLYWVDKITNVDYNEIDKPTPKDTKEVQYSLSLTNVQRELLEEFLKENNIAL